MCVTTRLLSGGGVSSFEAIGDFFRERACVMRVWLQSCSGLVARVGFDNIVASLLTCDVLGRQQSFDFIEQDIVQSHL